MKKSRFAETWIVKAITEHEMHAGPNTILSRYTPGRLPSRTLVETPVQFVKHKAAARFIESTFIIKYSIANGKLPPVKVNTMFR